jgi:hypothetical protein
MPAPSAPAEAAVMAELVAGDAASQPRDVNPWILHGSIWSTIAAVAVLAYGVLYANEPILAWAMAIAVVPALLITVVLSAVARLSGKPWDPVKKLLSFLSVFGITIAVATLAAVLLVISLIIGLLTLCFRELPH